MEGCNKVYLLVNGKKIAVSYDETEIEMKKSFELSTGDGEKEGR